MRPLWKPPHDDDGAADEATHTVDPPVPEQPADDVTTATTNIDPAPDPLAVAAAGPRERGALRRRLQRLRRARAKQLAALGTLVLDARRRSTGGSRPEVVARRAADAALVDRQVRELAHAVDGHPDRRELAAGVAGGCRECGTLLATEDRFCPSCGTPAKPGRVRAEDGAVAAQAAPAPAPPPQPAAPPLPPVAAARDR
jgi:hypothetical protein